MLVYHFVPFIVSNRYLLFWVSNGHNSVTAQNRTHVYMNFFDHKDLGNHLLQLCPKVVKHPVFLLCHLSLWHGAQLSTGTRTVSPFTLPAFHYKCILLCVISEIWHTFSTLTYSSIHTGWLIIRFTIQNLPRFLEALLSMFLWTDIL